MQKARWVMTDKPTEPQIQSGKHEPQTPWQQATPTQKAQWIQVVVCPVLNALMSDDCKWVGANIEYHQDKVLAVGAGPVIQSPNGVVSCNITFYREGLDRRG